MPNTRTKPPIPEKYLRAVVDLPPIVGTEKLAEFLGLEARSARRIPEWKLPRLKTAGGGRILFLREDVARYLAILAGELLP